MLKITKLSDAKCTSEKTRLAPLLDEASKIFAGIRNILSPSADLNTFIIGEDPSHNRAIVVLENNEEWEMYSPDDLMASSNFFYGDKHIFVENYRTDGITTVIGYARIEKPVKRTLDARFSSHKCIYIGWTEFDKVLCEIYGEGTESAREDNDYYKVSTPDGERLYDGDVTSEIEKYTGVKLQSSHVDENGVWFILTESDEEPMTISVIDGGLLQSLHTNVPNLKHYHLDYDNIRAKEDDDEDAEVARLEGLIAGGTLKNVW